MNSFNFHWVLLSLPAWLKLSGMLLYLHMHLRSRKLFTPWTAFKKTENWEGNVVTGNKVALCYRVIILFYVKRKQNYQASHTVLTEPSAPKVRCLLAHTLYKSLWISLSNEETAPSKKYSQFFLGRTKLTEPTKQKTHTICRLQCIQNARIGSLMHSEV